MRLALGWVLVLSLAGCATVESATRDDDRWTLGRLLRSGASPNGSGEDEESPLFLAIEQGNVPVARMLLRAGADPNRESHCRGVKVSPLEKAVIHRQLGLVRFLLDNGAEARPDATGHDVFVAMAKNTDGAHDDTVFVDAILDRLEHDRGREHVKAYLDEQRPDGWTPLAYAAYSGREEMLEALLRHGASATAMAAANNVDRSSSDLWPPLHFARARGDRDIRQRLVAAGADPGQKSRDGVSSDDAIGAYEARRAKEAEEAARYAAENARDEEESRQRMFGAFMGGLQNGLKNPNNPYLPPGMQPRPTYTPSSSSSSDDEKPSDESARQGDTPPERAPEPAAAEPVAAPAPSATGSSKSATGASKTAPPVSPAASKNAAAATAAAEARKREDDVRREREQARKAADAKRREDDDREKQRKAELARKEAERQRVEEQERREAQRRMDEREAQRNYLSAMRSGIRLRAGKCPSGGKNYWVMGVKPHIPPDGCINVAYEASCPMRNSVSSGMLRNFTGGDSCFGDSSEIPGQLSCEPKDVSVFVTDVQPCR